MKIKKYRTKKQIVAKREVSVSGFIPYKTFWDDTTIVTKKDWLMNIIKIGGFSFETADDEDVDIRKTIRNTLWKGMSSGNYGLYTHIIRTKKKAYDDGDLESDLPNAFARYLDEAWRQKHAGGNNYINSIYLTIIYKPNTEGVAGLEHMLNKMQQKADKGQWKTQMMDGYDNLVEMTGRIMNSLSDYKPQKLKIKKQESGLYVSEQLEFLGSIINCADLRTMQPSITDIAQYICTNRLFFGKRFIEMRGIFGSKFAGVVSIKEYASRTNAGMLDNFLQLPFEFVLSQSYQFIDRQVAIGKMSLQQARMMQSEDKAVSQMEEITEALDMAMSGSIGFGLHHATVTCVENNIKTLENSLSLATVELSGMGGVAVRERMNMEPAFWAQLPCNYDYIVRAATINTLNFAGLASFHNYPAGKQYNNHWGNAVTVFETTSGTPFYFNFHVRDVGHTTIIGPTGAGKTVLMNFLCAQAQQYHPRLFFFDKDRGAEIFVRAIGGLYTIIDPGKCCKFNPLQLDDTPSNRNFLSEWMQSMAMTYGDKITAEEVELISQAIEGNYKLDKKDRKLANIIPFLGMATPGSLPNRMAMWHTNGTHAMVFDNDKDELEFVDYDNFGFEMGKLLSDKHSLSPVLLYLFHRINMSLDGRPTMIVLDEAWALIDNPVFAPKIKDWLKVLRKLNCFVVFATQSVEDAAGSDISDTLIQQTATQIFLPNLRANAKGYMDSFLLSEREFVLIKTTDPGSRFFLLKQENDAVIARVNLQGMDDVINVLSGRADSVLLLDEIIEEYGDSPDDWLPVFCEKVKTI